MDLIKGKVAAIKSDYAVVINKGYKDGIEENMRFIIYEDGEEIFDPDSQESLGKLEYIKAKVIVKHPGEKISLAETYEGKMIPGAATAISSSVAALSRHISKYEQDKLLIDETTPRLLGGPATLKVKIGDLVRQIID
jgi:hypothetical protein